MTSDGVRDKRRRRAGKGALRPMPPAPDDPGDGYTRLDRWHDRFWHTYYAPMRFWRWLDVRHPEKGNLASLLVWIIIFFTFVILPTLIPHHAW